MKPQVRAILVLEIAGRPAEHVKKVLEIHVDKLNEQKDVEVINRTISEPKKLESEKGIYTCFAEVEIVTISLSRLMEIVFDFMPSSVEIFEPYDLGFSSQEATAFVNDLAGRLHKYDEIAKIAQFQGQQLFRKLQVAEKMLIDNGIVKPKGEEGKVET